MTNNEAPTEVLADIARRIVNGAMPATDSGATCFVPRYQVDQLSRALAAVRALAAWKVAGWAIVDNRGCESRCGLVLKDYGFGAVMEAAPPTAEHVAKLDAEYPGLAPHRLVTLYTAPPADPATDAVEEYRRGWADGMADATEQLTADPAKASEPEYDRSLIADMLDDYINNRGIYAESAIRRQIECLRSADDADAANVRTVRGSGSAPDDIRHEDLPREVRAHVEVLRAFCAPHDAGWRSLCRVMRALATPPASPVVEKPAYWEWRFFNNHPHTDDFGNWSEWERVIPRGCESLEDRLNEFREYISSGKRYQLRALFDRPMCHSVAAACHEAINRPFAKASASEVTDALMWLRSALDCSTFAWDADQRAAAEAALTAPLDVGRPT